MSLLCFSYDTVNKVKKVLGLGEKTSKGIEMSKNRYDPITE